MIFFALKWILEWGYLDVDEFVAFIYFIFLVQFINLTTNNRRKITFFFFYQKRKLQKQN